jgi:hypothetical protein
MASNEHPIVSQTESRISPYPYVYVCEDGTYRELSADERFYLETLFHPADGGRPYVKNSYASRTPIGKIGGFLRRDKLPLDCRRRG